jgi:YfiH family protein
LFSKTDLGYEFENKFVKGLFGHRQLDQAGLDKLGIDILRIKQVHGDQIFEWDKKATNQQTERTTDPTTVSVGSGNLDFQLPVADAHFSKVKNKALLINTADCLPIMIFDETSMAVAAIHAGWRGVENQITKKSLQKIKPANAIVWIGPHIMQNSFQVDLDVAKKLDPAGKYSVKKGEKFYVNLQEIVIGQIIDCGIKRSQILTLDIDTFTDKDFHSHRRQPTGLRNLNWIKLK